MKVFLLVALAVVVSANYVDNSALPLLGDWSLPMPLTVKAVKDKSAEVAVVGDAEIADGYIRVTPNSGGKEGAVWFTKPFPYASWEVAIDLRISGERFIGGDGLGFFYTQEKQQIGNTFGSFDLFHGLGIFFDTYDNDGKRDNPAVAAYLFNGDKKYDADTDGEQTRVEGAFCRVSLRNSRRPVHFKISYLAPERTLSMYYDIRGNGHFQQCFVVKDISLPTGWHFGLSAHTGAVADNHDVHAFLVRKLGGGEGEEEENGEKGEEKEEGEIEGKEPTDDERLKGLADAVQAWQKLPFDERDKKTASRRDKVRQIRKAAEEEGEGEHNHDHEHEEEEEGEAGKDGAAGGSKFEQKVSRGLARVQSVLTQMFSEVEEIGKGVADVNFDINTNILPMLSKAVNGNNNNNVNSPAPGATASQGQAAPASVSGGGVSGEEVEQRVRNVFQEKDLSSLIQTQTNQIKAIGGDVAEVKGIVRTHLDKQGQKARGQGADDETLSKLSIVTNEILKIKTLLNAIKEDREASSDVMKQHVQTIQQIVESGNRSTMMWILVFFGFQLLILFAYFIHRRIQDQKKMHLL